MSSANKSKVLAVCGGVGGAKLALGLQRILGPRLTVVVNVADDFFHRGLKICPDLDTVIYTLSGLNDEQKGWGRAGETWQFMEASKQLKADNWFLLGDKDLAIHVERTRRLAEGETLTVIVESFSRTLGATSRILPVTDDVVQTIVDTSIGRLEFQRYFVEHRCEPAVTQISVAGAGNAKLSPLVAEAFDDESLSAIMICPSNPYLSIDPILAVPEFRRKLGSRRVPAVAVSPIIGGKAVKGPTAKLMQELGIPTTSRSIADHYRGLIDGIVVDASDTDEARGIGLPVLATQTLMTDIDARVRLAQSCLAFAGELANRI
jgi:LPPG:FO 2-phospho-L-lactate transferase